MPDPSLREQLAAIGQHGGAMSIDQLRDEATDILERAFVEAVPRPDIAWAIGVRRLGHAALIAHWWALREVHLAGAFGSTIGLGTHLAGDPRQVWLEASDDTKVAVFDWAEIGGILPRRDQADPRMVAEISAALADRRAATPSLREVLMRDTPNEARSAEWAAIEDRCEEAAARVWDACRPAVQLDLFAILEGQ